MESQPSPKPRFGKFTDFDLLICFIVPCYVLMSQMLGEDRAGYDRLYGAIVILVFMDSALRWLMIYLYQAVQVERFGAAVLIVLVLRIVRFAISTCIFVLMMNAVHYFLTH